VNRLLLFPFSLLVSWAFPPWFVITRFLSTVMISGFIEIAQIWILGRVSDVVDFFQMYLEPLLEFLFTKSDCVKEVSSYHLSLLLQAALEVG